MQLSNREKLLVLVLTIVAIIGSFYYFIEKPQLKKIDELKKLKLDYQQKVQTLNAQTSANNEVYKKNKELENQIKDITVKFFPTINQEKIITILEDKFKASKFQPESLTFDAKKLTIPSADSENPESAGDTKKPEDKDLLGEMSMSFHSLKPVASKAEEKIAKDRKAFEAAVGSITRLGATLTFEGNYEDLSLFIKQLEADKRRVIIDGIQCERTSGDKLKGTVELSFYAIPKLFFQDDDYYQWNFNNKYGKYNPFFLSGGTAPIGSTTVNASDKVDFFMSLKPVASDVPAVMIGKKGTDLSSTYLYADNGNIENVEFQFTKVGTSYYYKYKTSKGSYPGDYSKTVQFTPKSKQIVIEIISTKRQSSDDKSGANIKITNFTGLSVQANVLFDDKKDHRAKFANNSGSVNISSTMEE